jgi:hypothetical protein
MIARGYGGSSPEYAIAHIADLYGACRLAYGDCRGYPKLNCYLLWQHGTSLGYLPLAQKSQPVNGPTLEQWATDRPFDGLASTAPERDA